MIDMISKVEVASRYRRSQSSRFGRARLNLAQASQPQNSGFSPLTLFWPIIISHDCYMLQQLLHASFSPSIIFHTLLYLSLSGMAARLCPNMASLGELPLTTHTSTARSSSILMDGRRKREQGARRFTIHSGLEDLRAASPPR